MSDFDCRISYDKYVGFNISVTHTGFAWASINAKSLKELKRVEGAIREYVAQVEHMLDNNDTIRNGPTEISE